MVTYEEARKFRESAGEPLTWDADIPAPPLDRIEFTRLILATVEDVGLCMPTWDESVPGDDDAESKFKAFQDVLYRYTYQQKQWQPTPYGLPRRPYSYTDEDGAHADAVRRLTWKEYIERLEYFYYFPWRTSWLYGVSDSKESATFAAVKGYIAREQKGYINSKPHLKGPVYPDAANLAITETISNYLHITDGRGLYLFLSSKTGVDLPLEESRWLGKIRADWPLFIYPTIVALILVTFIAGAITRLYSGWWLLLILPCVTIGSLLLWPYTPTGYKRCWLDPSLTFDDLVKKINEAKRQEWAYLQEFYVENANGSTQ